MPFWRRRDADDFSDEVRSHIELEEARLIKRGVAPNEARRRASIAFGSATNARERFRESSPWRWLETLWQDIRYSARLLKRSPAFALTAIIVLSLGIGMSVALFSIVNSVFFRRIPVSEADRVVYIFDRNEWGQRSGISGTTGPHIFRGIGESFAEFTAHWNISNAVSIADQTKVLPGEVVETNYFDVLRVPFALGRPFKEQENDPANPERAVVVSYDLWLSAFMGRADAIGSAIRVGSQTYRLVGVTTQGFHGLASPWAPSMWWVTVGQATGNAIGTREIARLKSGVSFEQFRAYVVAHGRQTIEEMWEGWPARIREKVPRARERSFDIVRIEDIQIPNQPDRKLIPTSVVVAVVVVVGLVLLIAAANVAGLLLARGTARVGEVAVRQALGAGGPRLFRQIVTESVVLCVIGGVGGSALAFALVRAFVLLTPERFSATVAIDARVLLFAVTTCMVTGVLIGLVPAVQATKVSLLQALGSGVVGARRTSGGLRRWVVIPQVAVSLVLAVVAVIHIRALREVELRDLGYRTAGAAVLTTGRWDPSLTRSRPGAPTPDEVDARVRRARQFLRQILDSGHGHPEAGILAVASSLPLGGIPQDKTLLADADQYQRGITVGNPASVVPVSERYFEAMGMRVVAGRSFDAGDGSYDDFRERVAVLSQSAARLLGVADVIGRQVVVTGGNKLLWLRVVGVVNDVDPVLDDGREHPVVYTSIRQEWEPASSVVVARSGNLPSAIAAARQVVLGADTFAEVTRVRTLEDMAAEILYPRRLGASILVIAGLIGLLLAFIGVYGVVAYSVAQREREMGIRSTLGATRAHILTLVLREGCLVVGMGVTAGAAIAVAALRATEGLVAGVPSFDVIAFAGVPAVLVLVILAASLLPALRASRVDPAIVLRGE